jgi:amino acid permease
MSSGGVHIEGVPAVSVVGVVLNLVNTVVGVGVLSIPYCFAEAGWHFN